MIPQSPQIDNTNHHENHDGYEPFSLSEDLYFDPSDEEDFCSQSEVNSQSCTNVALLPIYKGSNATRLHAGKTVECASSEGKGEKSFAQHAGAMTSPSSIQSDGGGSAALPKEGCVESFGTTDLALEPVGDLEDGVDYEPLGWIEMVDVVAADALECPHSVAMTMSKSDAPSAGVVVPADCDSWKCSECSHRLRRDWFHHLHAKLSTCEESLHLATLRHDQWEAARRRLNRHQNAHYVHVKTPNGLLVIATAMFAEDSQPILVDDALEELAKALIFSESVVDMDSRNHLVYTSRGDWEKPKNKKSSKYKMSAIHGNIDDAKVILECKNDVREFIGKGGKVMLSYKRRHGKAVRE